jgi:hypothetical protein
VKRAPRACVVLRGVDPKGRQVLRSVVSLERYHEGRVALIDDAATRTRKHVAMIRGAMFGSRGELLQVFESRYGSKGALVGSWAQHSDGTYVDVPIKPPPRAP